MRPDQEYLRSNNLKGFNEDETEGFNKDPFSGTKTLNLFSVPFM